MERRINRTARWTRYRLQGRRKKRVLVSTATTSSNLRPRITWAPLTPKNLCTRRGLQYPHDVKQNPNPLDYPRTTSSHESTLWALDTNYNRPKHYKHFIFAIRTATPAIRLHFARHPSGPVPGRKEAPSPHHLRRPSSYSTRAPNISTPPRPPRPPAPST